MEATQTVDWKLIVSFIALAISIGTFIFNAYFQVFRKPKLTVALGDVFTLAYGQNGELQFTRPVTFFNDGARYAAIISIHGIIYSLDRPNKSTSFAWRAFVESTDIGEKGKEFKPWWVFKGWVSTIIIGGHTAENENIGFKTEAAFPLEPGIFSIEYTIYGHQGKLASLNETFTVTEGNCMFLNQKCRSDESGVRSSTLTLTKDFVKS